MSYLGEDYHHLPGEWVVIDWLTTFLAISLPVVVLPGLYFHYSSQRQRPPVVKEAVDAFVPIPYHIMGPIMGALSIIIAITACLVWTKLYHFDSETSFHQGCNVANPLPSISYAIGSNYPERWFFLLAIITMSHQRLSDCFIIFNWFQRYLSDQAHDKHWWNSMLFVVHVVENLSLFAIAFFSAVEFPFLHEKSFHVWAVFQQARMLMQLYLLKNVTYPKGVEFHKRSIDRRQKVWLVNLLCIALGFVLMQIDIMNCNAGTPFLIYIQSVLFWSTSLSLQISPAIYFSSSICHPRFGFILFMVIIRISEAMAPLGLRRQLSLVSPLSFLLFSVLHRAIYLYPAISSNFVL